MSTYVAHYGSVTLPEYRASDQPWFVNAYQYQWLPPLPQPPEPVLVGGSAAVGDSSDTTYVAVTSSGRADNGEYVGYDVVVRWPALDATSHIPAGASVMDITIPPAGLRVRARTATDPSGLGDYASIQVGAYSTPAGFIYPIMYPNYFTHSASVTTSTTTLSPTVRTDNIPDPFIPAYYAEIGALAAQFRFIPDSTGYIYDVWFEGITVNYVYYEVIPDPIAPPLRQYPRDDGLAASSARRYWPLSRSTQRGNRRAGSTYP